MNITSFDMNVRRYFVQLFRVGKSARARINVALEVKSKWCNHCTNKAPDK